MPHVSAATPKKYDYMVLINAVMNYIKTDFKA